MWIFAYHLPSYYKSFCFISSYLYFLYFSTFSIFFYYYLSFSNFSCSLFILTNSLFSLTFSKCSIFSIACSIFLFASILLNIILTLFQYYTFVLNTFRTFVSHKHWRSFIKFHPLQQSLNLHCFNWIFFLNTLLKNILNSL